MEGIDAASAAFQVGYESPSQFNREYKRFFGQPPMQDIRSQRFSAASIISPLTSRLKTVLRTL